MPNSYPIKNIPPTVNTDNKNLNSNEKDPLESVGSQGFDKALGVVASEGEALLSLKSRQYEVIANALTYCLENNHAYALSLGRQHLAYENVIGLKPLIDLFRNLQGVSGVEYQDWLQACLDGCIDDDIPACFEGA